MNYIYDAILESNRIEDDMYKESRKRKTPTSKSIKESKDTEDTLKEGCKDKKLNEDKLVDIENYLEPENYMESVEETDKDNLNESKQKIVECNLPDRPTKGRPGSPEYDSNDNRKKRYGTTPEKI